jgi:hypothetical protein
MNAAGGMGLGSKAICVLRWLFLWALFRGLVEMRIFMVLTSAAVCSLTGATALAERAPRSPTELREEARLVVVGRIEDVRVGSERSHIERGFGNQDWTIDLVIRVSDLEKGTLEGEPTADSETIVARCFRIKSRKSMQEFLTPSGNQWIPGVGTDVRAYLYKDGAVWRVIFPNGLAPLQDGGDVQDTPAVAGLGSGFTYLVPLELWILGLVISLPCILGLLAIVAWQRRKSASQRVTGGAPQSA